MKKTLVGLVVVTAAALTATCTVHQTDQQSLSGPSTFALSLTVQARPDHVGWDGSSTSVISVAATDYQGNNKSYVPLRLDTLSGGVVGAYGTLSQHTIDTLPASVTYTAPPPPAASASTNCGGQFQTVTIRATTVGTNAQATQSSTADIQLVPSGVNGPIGPPVAAFSYRPQPAIVNVPMTFDASASTPGTNARQIISYAWDFGDNTPKASGPGATQTHTFANNGTFNVTLTVTNEGCAATSTTVAVAVGVTDPFTGDWYYSPLAPLVGDTVMFNATQIASPGQTITSYNWDFGDGTSGAGATITHAFTLAQTYNVRLTVTDNTGRQKFFPPKAITVGTGAPGVQIIFSPTSPKAGSPVNFSAVVTLYGNATVVSTQWNFGDGSASTASSPAHVYAAAGTYNVTLAVTDSQGRIGIATVTVTVTP